MRTIQRGKYFCVLLLWLTLAALCRPANAALALYYDFDSLIYLSSDIVDAELTGPTSAKVLLTYKGATAAGENIALPRTPGGFFKSKAGTRRLQAGDHVTLFLTKKRNINARSESDVYMEILPGTRVQYEGRIYKFHPFSDYIATDVALLKGGPPRPLFRIEDFQKKLAQSMQFVDAATPFLKGRATFANLPELMDILRNRATHDFEEWDGMDIIKEDACAQIVALHDFNTLVDAMLISGSYYMGNYSPNGALTNGFRIPAGRQFLFRVVRDASQPESRRLVCAKALAGVAFGPLTEIPKSVPSKAPVAEDGKINEEFLAATLALLPDVRRSEPITAAILSGLEWLAGAVQQPEKIKAHSAELRKFYSESHSEAARFWIEKIFLEEAGVEGYQSLKPTSGPVLSLVQNAVVFDNGKNVVCAAIERDTIKIFQDRAESSYDSGPALILLNPRTEQRYTLTLIKVMDSRNHQEYSLYAKWALPDALPPGIYRLFWEFKREEKVISAGHYLEIKL